MGIVYLFVFSIYFIAPLPIRLLMLLINLLAPDPIPVLDEVIMVAGILSKLAFLEEVVEFIEDHPVVSICIGCIVIVLIVILICAL
jgi:hypothetical protein